MALAADDEEGGGGEVDLPGRRVADVLEGETAAAGGARQGERALRRRIQNTGM